MLPASQNLKSGQPPSTQLHQRLEERHKLVIFKCAAHFSNLYVHANTVWPNTRNVHNAKDALPTRASDGLGVAKFCRNHAEWDDAHGADSPTDLIHPYLPALRALLFVLPYLLAHVHNIAS